MGQNAPSIRSLLNKPLCSLCAGGISQGMKPEDVIATYQRVGLIWAQQRRRDLYEKAWLDKWLIAAPRSQGAIRVLDLGCGSGLPIGRYLSERNVDLVGVDAAPAMTTIYGQNIPKAEALTADMRGLSLGRQFDAILAWDSFFHLSAKDQRTMFATFAAHAAPSATLMFTSGHIAGEVIGQVADTSIYHASLAPAEYRELLETAGFRVLHYKPEDPDCTGHTVWLAQFTR